MLALYTRIKNCYDDESGQTAVEYTLLLAVITLAVVAVVPAITGKITAVFNSVIAAL